MKTKVNRFSVERAGGDIAINAPAFKPNDNQLDYNWFGPKDIKPTRNFTFDLRPHEKVEPSDSKRGLYLKNYEWISKRFFKDVTVLDYDEELINGLELSFSKAFNENIQRIFDNAPSYYKNFIAPNVSMYQLYLFALFFIIYVHDHDDEKLNKLYHSWVEQQWNGDLYFLLRGPDDNQTLTNDFTLHYYCIVRPTYEKDTIISANQLSQQKKISLMIGEQTGVIRHRPNAYDKLRDKHRKTTLLLNTNNKTKINIDDRGFLVFDFSNHDFRHGADVEGTTNALSQFQRLMQRYGTITIKNMTIDADMFLQPLDSFKEVYVVFEGIIPSMRTVNNCYNFSYLYFPGRFEARNGGIYEFIPNEDSITYESDMVQVKNIRLYITTTLDPNLRNKVSVVNPTMPLKMSNSYNVPYSNQFMINGNNVIDISSIPLNMQYDLYTHDEILKNLSTTFQRPNMTAIDPGRTLMLTKYLDSISESNPTSGTLAVLSATLVSTNSSEDTVQFDEGDSGYYNITWSNYNVFLNDLTSEEFKKASYYAVSSNIVPINISSKFYDETKYECTRKESVKYESNVLIVTTLDVQRDLRRITIEKYTPIPIVNDIFIIDGQEYQASFYGEKFTIGNTTYIRNGSNIEILSSAYEENNILIYKSKPTFCQHTSYQYLNGYFEDTYSYGLEFLRSAGVRKYDDYHYMNENTSIEYYRCEGMSGFIIYSPYSDSKLSYNPDYSIVFEGGTADQETFTTYNDGVKGVYAENGTVYILKSAVQGLEEIDSYYYLTIPVINNTVQFNGKTCTIDIDGSYDFYTDIPIINGEFEYFGVNTIVDNGDEYVITKPNSEEINVSKSEPTFDYDGVNMTIDESVIHVVLSAKEGPWYMFGTDNASIYSDRVMIEMNIYSGGIISCDNVDYHINGDYFTTEFVSSPVKVFGQLYDVTNEEVTWTEKAFSTTDISYEPYTNKVVNSYVYVNINDRKYYKYISFDEFSESTVAEYDAIIIAPTEEFKSIEESITWSPSSDYTAMIEIDPADYSGAIVNNLIYIRLFDKYYIGTDVEGVDPNIAVGNESNYRICNIYDLTREHIMQFYVVGNLMIKGEEVHRETTLLQESDIEVEDGCYYIETMNGIKVFFKRSTPPYYYISTDGTSDNYTGSNVDPNILLKALDHLCYEYDMRGLDKESYEEYIRLSDSYAAITGSFPFSSWDEIFIKYHSMLQSIPKDIRMKNIGKLFKADGKIDLKTGQTTDGKSYVSVDPEYLTISKTQDLFVTNVYTSNPLVSIRGMKMDDSMICAALYDPVDKILQFTNGFEENHQNFRFNRNVPIFDETYMIDNDGIAYDTMSKNVYQTNVAGEELIHKGSGIPMLYNYLQEDYCVISDDCFNVKFRCSGDKIYGDILVCLFNYARWIISSAGESKAVPSMMQTTLPSGKNASILPYETDNMISYIYGNTVYDLSVARDNDGFRLVKRLNPSSAQIVTPEGAQISTQTFYDRIEITVTETRTSEDKPEDETGKGEWTSIGDDKWVRTYVIVEELPQPTTILSISNDGTFQARKGYEIYIKDYSSRLDPNSYIYNAYRIDMSARLMNYNEVIDSIMMIDMGKFEPVNVLTSNIIKLPRTWVAFSGHDRILGDISFDTSNIYVNSNRYSDIIIRNTEILSNTMSVNESGSRSINFDCGDGITYATMSITLSETYVTSVEIKIHDFYNQYDRTIYKVEDTIIPSGIWIRDQDVSYIITYYEDFISSVSLSVRYDDYQRLYISGGQVKRVPYKCFGYSNKDSWMITTDLTYDMVLYNQPSKVYEGITHHMAVMMNPRIDEMLFKYSNNGIPNELVYIVDQGRTDNEDMKPINMHKTYPIMSVNKDLIMISGVETKNIIFENNTFNTSAIIAIPEESKISIKMEFT